MDSYLDRFHALMQGDTSWMTLDVPMTEPVALEARKRLSTDDVALAFGQDYRYVHPTLPELHWEWSQAYARLGIRLPSDARFHGDGHVDRLPPAGSTGKAWHLTEMLHPLAQIDSVEDLDSLPWHHVDVEAATQELRPQVQELHEKGFVVVLPLECTVFENVWYRRSMELFFSDLADGNPVSERLLTIFEDRSTRIGTAGALAGVDLVRLGDDVGTQRGMLMSVGQWREVLKPRLARVARAIRNAADGRRIYLQYHSDGDIRPILGDLVEIGIDILNPVQPECMPLEEVVPEWKDRLAFSGMIGTQTTMPFGTPQDVVAAVERCRSHADQGARMLIAPTHVLEPDVPWENILALVDAVHRARKAKSLS